MGYVKRVKLIEVAIPLETINAAAAKEKSIRQGHPATLHLWWARRPLAACRAVLFAQLVDDPSSNPDRFPTQEAQKRERKRLFAIIESLVEWENSNNEKVLDAARQEILKSCDDNPPAVLDPFCGGGSIPLEAQRLGLKAYASDLNPVAVLITKALTEIPSEFANRPPINPEARKRLVEGAWKGAQGLADDVRYYGKWLRDKAEHRIGHLYPRVKVNAEMTKARDDLKSLANRELTVIAWLWARTVKCPNPACGAMMPLARSFVLSTKRGRDIWVEPISERGSVRFEVRSKDNPKIAGSVSRKGAICVACMSPVGLDYIRSEGMAGRMGTTLMAVVAGGERARVYLSPSAAAEAKLTPSEVEQVEAARSSFLAGSTPQRLTGGTCYGYGLTTWGKLFTPRQLIALTTFSDLVDEARERALNDARAASAATKLTSSDERGQAALAYANAIATYLGLCVSRSANTLCSLAIWSQSRDQSVNVFSRQALPMTWDFPEVNPLAGAAGDFGETSASMSKSISSLPTSFSGLTDQRDACVSLFDVPHLMVTTDPPYYDNIGYADLSDFFYVWMRRSIGKIHPQLFSTLLVPKEQELVANPARFEGNRERAQTFFEEGLTRTFAKMRDIHDPEYPLTVFYAFKQAETEASDNDNSSTVLASTGWETMLQGLIGVGFQITGTWPMRTERPTGVKIAVNALASSVVLACRHRPDDAPLAARRELVSALRAELPFALKTLQGGSIAPVDLAQAAIGPGMAIFSRYSKVLETDGSPMRVRTALGLINQALDEVLAEQETEYDAETQWALAWFEQYGIDEGKHGDADNLARAKNTAPNALEEAGIIWRKAGKVQLISREKMSADWDPRSRGRVTIWEVTQHLIRALETEGEVAAATILRRLPAVSEAAKDLAYRLFTICDRKGWSQAALPYNMLVASWPELQRLAASTVGLTQELPAG